jgi:hypothetical protein
MAKNNNCCVTALVILFELVAVAAALIAISSSFWIGTSFGLFRVEDLWF